MIRNARIVDLYGRPIQIRQARFDSAFAGGPQRATPPQAVTIFSDMQPGVRRALVASSRDLADNSPTIRGLIERMVTYVIGSGLWPVTESSDQAFNDEANAAFREFADDCDIRGGVGWAELQRQLYRSELRDGDSGAILTTNKDGSPRVWACEGLDIGSPSKPASQTYFDGVTIDPIGGRRAYDIRRPMPNGGWSEVVPVAVDLFAHFADLERPGQIRGIPILAAALNTGRDVKEILEIEKLALKDASTKVDIITTQTGELDAETLVTSGGATLNGSDGEDSRAYYREIGMPESKVLRTGDTWQAYKNDRPSQTWQGFMSFLTETICLAAKIPPSILLQIKVGGADTRRDLAAAERIFSLTQDRLTNRTHFGKIRDYVVTTALGNRLPKDWRKVSWQTPKAITADAGREAQQDREDVRAGLMTRREYFGRWAQNNVEQADQVEREARDVIRRARKIETEEKVSFEVALELLGAPEVQPENQIQANVIMPSDGGVKPATESNDDAAASGTIQDTALNGAQLKSVQDIVQSVSLKQLPADAAIQLLKLALPLADESMIKRMVDSAVSFTPKPIEKQEAA